jgi:hypothetical protein
LAGWYHAIANKKLDAIVVSYEDMLSDYDSVFESVVRFCGMDLPLKTDVLNDSSDVPLFTRKNVGVTGRDDILSEAQSERINALVLFYPDVDFTILGVI